MRRISFILIAALVAIVASSGTYSQWREGGKKVPDTDASKSKDDFGAMLLLTSKPDEFFEQWNRPPSPDYKPNIQTTSEVRRGDVIVAVVIFTGCQADTKGLCDSEVDFKVLFPNGKVYGQHDGADLWKHQRPPDNTLQVSQGYLGVTIEPDDPFGTYTVEAVARDKYAKISLPLTLTFDVVKEGTD